MPIHFYPFGNTWVYHFVQCEVDHQLQRGMQGGQLSCTCPLHATIEVTVVMF